MYVTHALIAAAQTPATGFTLAALLAGLPHDPASIFVYVLLIVTFGTIFWVGRARKPAPREPGS